MKIASWVLAIAIAAILVQTLYFKFTGAPESIYIFEKTGLGDAGRYGSGLAELIASILLLIPRTRVLGALLALGVIAGAIFSHLTVLGIEVMGDGGTLFYLALIVCVCSLTLIIMHRKELPVIGKRF
jgi:uncharacterized membrane protein YphA (DoxX/SURF4 family)